MHIRVLAITALLAAPAQSAIIFQQTVGPGSVTLSDFLPTTPSQVWIGLTGGSITSVDWAFQADYEKWWWELLYEDEFGNQEIYLNGNNYQYIVGCATSPGNPACTSSFGFRSQLKNNTARIGFKAPRSYGNCFPFNGQFNVDCAFLYQAPFAVFNIAVTGAQPMTVTISSTRIAGAVPEPGSWALLVAGFGLTGAALRRRARPQASG